MPKIIIVTLIVAIVGLGFGYLVFGKFGGEYVELSTLLKPSKNVLQDIARSDDNSLEKDFFPKYDSMDYEVDGFYFDIGTREGIEWAKRYLNGEKIELEKRELTEEERKIVMAKTDPEDEKPLKRKSKIKNNGNAI